MPEIGQGQFTQTLDIGQMPEIGQGQFTQTPDIGQMPEIGQTLLTVSDSRNRSDSFNYVRCQK
jgi:hypothetical protein